MGVCTWVFALNPGSSPGLTEGCVDQDDRGALSYLQRPADVCLALGEDDCARVQLGRVNEAGDAAGVLCSKRATTIEEQGDTDPIISDYPTTRDVDGG